MTRKEFQERTIGKNDEPESVKKTRAVGGFYDVKEYPLDDERTHREGDTDDMRLADEGEDVLGREYSDAVLERLGGGLRGKTGGDPDAIPNAGSGETFEGDTRDVAYRPQAFTSGDGTVGQVPRPLNRRPNVQNGEPYELLAEGKEPSSFVTRVGDNWLLQGGSGIAPASAARFPDDSTAVLKSERPKVGIFKSAVFGRQGSDQSGDNFLSE